MPLSQQEIFNKVMTHLFAQGEPAKNEHDECAYRGLDGKQCAVGCLIPDELYDKKMEGWEVTEVFYRFPNVRDYLGKDNIFLLTVLQALHDGYGGFIGVWNSTEEMRKAARRIAEDYDLDASILDTLSFADR